MDIPEPLTTNAAPNTPMANDTGSVPVGVGDSGEYERDGAAGENVDNLVPHRGANLLCSLTIGVGRMKDMAR